MVAQISPNALLLLMLHVVHLLLLMLHHLGLGHLLSFHLALFHLLFFHLLVADHIHLVPAFRFLDLLLLLHHHGVGLHVDGDNERGEGVSTHDTSIEHNILGGHLANIVKEGVISNGCFKFEVTKISQGLVRPLSTYIYSL